MTNPNISDSLRIFERPKLHDATLVLSFTGWMDGGDVSTGTVRRLIELLDAYRVAEIDPEEFYILSFPGSMEIASLFRPHIRVHEGIVEKVDMPENAFYCHAEANLLLFVGREPNMRWRTFAETIFQLCREFDVRRILFVGSFGGPVPHTREPRLYTACSDPKLLPAMEKFGVTGTDYEGPGSFTSYLQTRVADAGVTMASVIAEIPAYLQGMNPASIAAVTRRLAVLLQLPLDLDALRTASTEWELQVSSAVEQDADMAEKIREMERDYDDALLENDET